jgi:hypothetical protein
VADPNEKNIQDLKARLGLAKAAKAAPAKEEPKAAGPALAPAQEPGHEDEAEGDGEQTPLPGPLPGGRGGFREVGFSEAPAFNPPTAVQDVQVDESAAKRGRGALLLVGLVGLVVFFGLGYLAGKIFKERTIGNYKILEAQQAVDYFEKHQVAETGQKTLDAIAEHKARVQAIVAKVEKAREAGDLESVRGDMMEFLGQAAVYAGSQVRFDTSGLYREGWYAAELIPTINAFTASVDALHAKTQTVAREAALIANIQAMQEERSANPGAYVRRILLEQKELNGVPWNTGAFLAQVAEPEQIQPEVPEGIDPATISPEWQVAVLPEGQEKGVRVPTTEVAGVDFGSQIAPLEKQFEESALRRVADTIVDMRMAAEAVVFEPVKQKLDEVAKKEPYFTF